MTERGIIFNAEMVRAVLDGRKTQTRRIIQSPAKNMQASGQKVIDYREPGDKWYGDHVFSMRNQSGTWCDYTSEQFLAKCPFGAAGDRLWVRETWARYNIDQNSHDMAYRATTPDDWPKEGRWRPSIHMQRWASRITLEITGVRVERLKSISEEDAAAEGVGSAVWFAGKGVPEEQWTSLGEHGAYRASHINSFATLWESIYGADSWQANPWVWVIEFKRMEDDKHA